MLEKTIFLIGPKASGITMYLLALYQELVLNSTNEVILKDQQSISTKNYFEFLIEEILERKEYPKSTIFDELFYHRINFEIEGKHEETKLIALNLIETGASLEKFNNTELFEKFNQEKTFFQNIKTNSGKISPIFLEYLQQLQKAIKDGTSFLFLINPLYFNKEIHEQLFITVLKAIYEENQLQQGNKLKIGLILTLSDLFPEHLNDPKYFVENFVPNLVALLKEYQINYECFSISSLGKIPELSKIDDKWVHLPVSYLVPINVLDPIEFIINEKLDIIL